MGWIDWLRQWFTGLNGASQATVVGALLAAVIGGLKLLWTIVWNIVTHFSNRKTATQDSLLDKVIETLGKQLDTKDKSLLALQEREKSLHAELRKAVLAIPKQTVIPGAKAKIKEALEEATKGNTKLAEAIFYEVEERKAGEGIAANKEAAEAARHRGALAFLHNTDKALAAYRRATELDPENADGWNNLGVLLHRTGELNGAEVAFHKIESLGEQPARLRI